MGNCTVSKLVNGGGGADFEEDAVSLCKERKRLLKIAVSRRQTLSESHHLYFLSLRSVAAALNLFVASHSSPSALLLAGPPETRPESVETRPETVQTLESRIQTPTEPKIESFEPRGANLKAEESGGYYFSGVAVSPIPPPSPMREFGWDFFNPFLEEAAIFTGLARGSEEEEELRVVRGEEGIPELEEVEDDKRNNNVVEGVEVNERRLTWVAATEKEEEEEEEEEGRELLEALREIEDLFIRVFECGKEVGRMLEVNQEPDHDDIIKENSSKIIQALTWNRSPSTQSSSNKSYLSSSTKDTSSVKSRSDVFEDYGGMESGSHSQTLGRLYAWEKKLFEEVKTGDHTRQVYEKKCFQLRNHEDAKGADSCSLDKIKATVTDLYTSILVALRSIETISTQIQKVRDEELQPQLIELLQGLMKTWKIMVESHETQKQIMSEVKSFSCSAYGKYCTNSQRQVTVQLEAELRNWRKCFMSYISAQREYVEALNGWLSKFFIPHIRVSSSPPLLIISQNWLNSSKRLPDKSVSIAMKGFIKATRVLWVKQGEEQQQKRKVDGLAKELDRKVLSLQKTENKVLEMKLSDLKPEPDMRDRVEYLAGRRELLGGFRKKVEIEKEKHQGCMRETRRVTVDGFKIGLSGVFDTLTDFSKDCLKLYTALLAENERGMDNKGDKTQGKAACLEGSHSGADSKL